MFSQLVTLCSGVMSIIALATMIFKPLREKVFGTKKITEGQRCLLRSDMLRLYYKHKDADTIRQFELENFILEYNAYKALGGNSFIDRVYEEVKKWDVVS